MCVMSWNLFMLNLNSLIAEPSWIMIIFSLKFECIFLMLQYSIEPRENGASFANPWPPIQPRKNCWTSKVNRRWVCDRFSHFVAVFFGGMVLSNICCYLPQNHRNGMMIPNDEHLLAASFHYSSWVGNCWICSKSCPNESVPSVRWLVL